MSAVELHTARYRMRYAVRGDGPPLVFIHGMADVGRSFEPVIRLLADRFTCVHYDLPTGCGDGAALGQYTLPHYAADLVALLNHLRFRQATLLGSSFGSLIALTALVTTPERFTHGILQGGFARRPFRPWEFRLAQVARFWPGWMGDWPGLHDPIMARVQRDVAGGVSPEVWRFFLSNHGRTPCRAAALRSLSIVRTDLRPLLPSIRTPVLMIGGDCDPLVPRWCEREVEAGLPDVRRVEIPGCGHYPQYTHPTAMADAIGRFRGERGDPLKPRGRPP